MNTICSLLNPTTTPCNPTQALALAPSAEPLNNRISGAAAPRIFIPHTNDNSDSSTLRTNRLSLSDYNFYQNHFSHPYSSYDSNNLDDKAGSRKSVIPKKEELGTDYVSQSINILDRCDARLINPETRNKLIKLEQEARWVSYGLEILQLSHQELVTEKNLDCLLNHASNIEAIVRALDALYVCDPDLITQENFDAIIQSGSNALQFAQGRLIIHLEIKHSPEIVNLLVESKEHAVNLATMLITPQVLIASREKYAYEVAKGIFILLKELSTPSLTPMILKTLLDSQNYAVQVAEAIAIAYRKNPSQVTQKNPSQVTQGILEILVAKKEDALKTIPFLMTPAIFDILQKSGKHVIQTGQAMLILHKLRPDLLNNKEICTMLLQAGDRAEMLAERLVMLDKAYPDYLHREDIQKHLLDSETNILPIAMGILVLCRANPDLLSAPFLKMITQDGPFSDKIAEGIAALYKCNPDLLNARFLKMITQGGQFSDKIAEGIVLLYKQNQYLFDSKLIEIIEKRGEFFKQTVNSIVSLHLISPKMFKIFTDNVKNFEGIKSFDKLCTALQKIPNTPETCQLLIDSSPNAYSMALAIKTLSGYKPELLQKPEIREMLIESSPNACFMAVAIETLSGYKPELLQKPEICQLLIKSGPNACSMAMAIETLSGYKPELLQEPEICKMLIDSASRSKEMSHAIKSLSTHRPDLLDNLEIRKMLIESSNPYFTCTKILFFYENNLDDLNRYENNLDDLNQPKILEIIKNDKRSDRHILEGILALHRKNSSLLKQKNFWDVLTEYTKNDHPIGFFIQKLYKLDRKLLKNDIIDEILKAFKPQNSTFGWNPEFVQTFEELRSENPSLLQFLIDSEEASEILFSGYSLKVMQILDNPAQPNNDLRKKNIEMISGQKETDRGSFYKAIKVLHATDPSFVNERNLEALKACGENILQIQSVLEDLAENKILTQYTVDLLFDRSGGKIEPIMLSDESPKEVFGDMPEIRYWVFGNKPRYWPAQITQESLENFRSTFLAAKYHPEAPSIKQIKKKYIIQQQQLLIGRSKAVE